jgi:hypothetical protein
VAKRRRRRREKKKEKKENRRRWRQMGKKTREGREGCLATVADMMEGFGCALALPCVFLFRRGGGGEMSE